MTNVIAIRSHANESESRTTLDALCLEGACTMLHRALEVEVTESTWSATAVRVTSHGHALARIIHEAP